MDMKQRMKENFNNAQELHSSKKKMKHKDVNCGCNKKKEQAIFYGELYFNMLKRIFKAHNFPAEMNKVLFDERKLFNQYQVDLETNTKPKNNKCRCRTKNK